MIDPNCEYCGGTGEVATDETDRDGNVERGVGTRKCICTLHDKNDDYEQESE